MSFAERYKEKIENIDKYISDFLSGYKESEPVIVDAMRYSVLNGGKRLRSVLCTEVCKMLGGNVDNSMPFAAAVELIHAYSLVHDDLPAMDNADMRRNQPSCHKKYGEAIGVLCGDALLNSAFEILISNCNNLGTQRAAMCIASSSGICGMINGQIRDLQIGSSAVKNPDILIKMVEQKTMAMIKCSILSGTYIANANDRIINDMKKFSYHLGLAFQLRDDFEDINEDASAESDCPNFINAFGEKKARECLIQNSEEALKILNLYDKEGFLCELHKFLFDYKN